MGYRWYAIDWSLSPPRGDVAEIIASRDLLGRFIEEATARYATDRDRVYLFGFSQGAIMSVSLLLAQPELVRGVVAHSGRLARLPGQVPTTAASLARAEALVLHGTLDEVVPVAQGRKIQEVLSPLLGTRVAYREFEHLGHGIDAESLGEAARWLTARLDLP